MKNDIYRLCVLAHDPARFAGFKTGLHYVTKTVVQFAEAAKAKCIRVFVDRTLAVGRAPIKDSFAPALVKLSLCGDPG